MHTQLQKALARAKVPYCVVGGKSLFERVSVLDLMAYLRLSILSGAERDDDAFRRVLNRPTRRLPEKVVLPAIERQRQAMVQGGRGASLEVAARQMQKTGVGLKKAQRTQLGKLLVLIDRLRTCSARAELPQLLKQIWVESELGRMHGAKGKKTDVAARAPQSEARQADDDDEDDGDDDDDDEDSDDDDGDEEDEGDSSGDKEDIDNQSDARPRPSRPPPSQASTSAAYFPDDQQQDAALLPGEIQVLIEHAKDHVAERVAVEKQTALSDLSRDGTGVHSLFFLCRSFILENEALLPFQPEEFLPDFVLDSHYASIGCGREVGARDSKPPQGSALTLRRNGLYAHTFELPSVGRWRAVSWLKSHCKPQYQTVRPTQSSMWMTRAV